MAPLYRILGILRARIPLALTPVPLISQPLASPIRKIYVRFPRGVYLRRFTRRANNLDQIQNINRSFRSYRSDYHLYGFRNGRWVGQSGGWRGGKKAYL